MQDYNRDKSTTFDPGWWLQPRQKAPVPPLAQLAIGPGIKATFCPGPKDSRDKWPGTKPCSVVVESRVSYKKKKCETKRPMSKVLLTFFAGKSITYFWTKVS